MPGTVIVYGRSPSIADRLNLITLLWLVDLRLELELPLVVVYGCLLCANVLELGDLVTKRFLLRGVAGAVLNFSTLFVGVPLVFRDGAVRIVPSLPLRVLLVCKEVSETLLLVVGEDVVELSSSVSLSSGSMFRFARTTGLRPCIVLKRSANCAIRTRNSESFRGCSEKRACS